MSRHNYDYSKNTFKKDCISGKYLNQIHLELVNFGFYNILYKKIFYIYLRLTNYETLDTMSQDSMFARSLLYVDSKRNPQYYNKPGLKVHSLVDSLRTVISFDLSECDIHDSIYVDKL